MQMLSTSSLFPAFHLPRPRTVRLRPPPSAAPDASTAEIPLYLGRDGVYSADAKLRARAAVVLWDLDNKPPRGPPYDAAVALRRLATPFGSPLHLSAYANRHAFHHVPSWVREDRRGRRDRDFLERHAPPSNPYPCGVCGRKFPTHADLRRHFRSLHERERNKKLARMRSLRGKRRQRYRERFVSGNTKYEEAERDLAGFPRAGYRLARELRRAGVRVRTVQDQPQAADAALKGEMRHWASCGGAGWLFLVSDDSDFTEMVRRARESETRTVVVGDWKSSLGRHADVWLPWAGVENGEVGPEVVHAGGWKGREGDAFGGGGPASNESGLDGIMDEIVRWRSEDSSDTHQPFLEDGSVGGFFDEKEEADSDDDDDDDDDSDDYDEFWDSEDDLYAL